MSAMKNQEQIETEGRKLAGMLYDLPMPKLANPSNETLEQWRHEYPNLDRKTFDNILTKVKDARLYHQERVGWQAIPHDLTVILFVLGTVLFGLKTGIIIGIATLVFLEGLFQFIFVQKLYRPLSLLVWLTYPAYLVLAYYLYKQGFYWYLILAIVLAVWFGTFLLGQVARIPLRLLVGAMQEIQDNKSHNTKD